MVRALLESALKQMEHVFQGSLWHADLSQLAASTSAEQASWRRI